jgi:hypothetical protein
MAIRIVGLKGIADTQAELLASTSPSSTSVYCIDTGNTYTRISGIWAVGNYIGVEDDIDVVDGVTEYFINTTNAGKVITINLPLILSEGITWSFKRSDSSLIGGYDIIFTANGYTIDFSLEDLTLTANGLLPSINLTKFNSNFNIT